MTVTGKPQKFMMRQQMMNELNLAEAPPLSAIAASQGYAWPHPGK
jgi:hypothetical protein